MQSKANEKNKIEIEKIKKRVPKGERRKKKEKKKQPKNRGKKVREYS